MELRMKMRLKRRQSWLRICGSIFAILHIVYSPAVADFYTCFPGIEPSAGGKNGWVDPVFERGNLPAFRKYNFTTVSFIFSIEN